MNVLPQKERIAAIKEAVDDKKGTVQYSSSEVKEVPLIQIPIGVLIHNSDNTRNLHEVLDYTGKKEVAEAYQILYEKRDDAATQKILNDWNLDEAKTSSQSIYKTLRNNKIQGKDHLIIDGEGIVIDGNRRLASMRDLYQTDPIGFKKFEQISCLLATEVGFNKNNRKIAEQIEKFINRTKDMRLPHNWLSTAFRNSSEIDSIRATIKSHEVNEAVEILGNELGMSVPEVFKFLYKKEAVTKYLEFRKEYDEDWDEDEMGYSTLSKEKIEQDMEEIGKVFFKRISPEEKDLRAKTAFTVVFGQKKGYTTYYKRSYELTKNPKFIGSLWKEAAKKEAAKDALEVLKETLKLGNDGIKTAARKIEEQKILHDNKSESSKNEKLVINTISTFLNDLDGLEVSNLTVLEEDVSGIIKNLDTLINESQKKKKEVKDIEF